MASSTNSCTPARFRTSHLRNGFSTLPHISVYSTAHTGGGGKGAAEPDPVCSFSSVKDGSSEELQSETQPEHPASKCTKHKAMSRCREAPQKHIGEQNSQSEESSIETEATYNFCISSAVKVSCINPVRSRRKDTCSARGAWIRIPVVCAASWAECRSSRALHRAGARPRLLSDPGQKSLPVPAERAISENCLLVPLPGKFSLWVRSVQQGSLCQQS